MPASLGDLDELVLLSVGILHPDAYAYAIKEKIHAETGHRPALPTIHTALYRLEDRGMLDSEMGGATAERGGRRKRLFSITNKGLAALREVRTTRNTMWDLMQGLQPSGGTA